MQDPHTHAAQHGSNKRVQTPRSHHNQAYATVLACRPFLAVGPGLLANLFTGISDPHLGSILDTGLLQNVLARLYCLGGHLEPVLMNLL